METNGSIMASAVTMRIKTEKKNNQKRPDIMKGEDSN
jgi:hypothetical protein